MQADQERAEGNQAAAGASGLLSAFTINVDESSDIMLNHDGRWGGRS